MSNEIKNTIDNALFNFYLEADKETINDSLKHDIPNLDVYDQKRKKIIFLAKATAQKAHNEYLMQAVNRFHEALLNNIEKPVAILRQLIHGNPTFALYNNFDKLSKEDIIDIIKDKNLIDLIEQIEEDDKNY